MIVKKITYKKTNKPKGSCGTGYSLVDKFVFTDENGKEHEVYIDIWYASSREIYGRFLSAVWRLNVSNIKEAYNMYVEEIVNNKRCPYTKEQLIIK